MKKSFTLMEVLISLFLISVAIYSIVNLKNNNIFLVEKIDESSKKAAYINLLVSKNKTAEVNEKIYLKDFYKVSDDTLRKELKDKKITQKSKIIENNDINYDEIQAKYSLIKTVYETKDGYKKSFFEIRIE